MVLSIQLDCSSHNYSTVIIKTSQVGENKKPSDFYDLVDGFGRLMGLLWHLEMKLDCNEQKVIKLLLDLLNRENKSKNIRGKNLWNILRDMFPVYHQFHYQGSKDVIVTTEKVAINTTKLIKTLQKVIPFPAI